jgi:hypothetical protein
MKGVDEASAAASGFDRNCIFYDDEHPEWCVDVIAPLMASVPKLMSSCGFGTDAIHAHAGARRQTRAPT